MSEAMLQQTQVARVVERYVSFLLRFPTVVRLAEASEQEVLAAWQGLGYYGRARRLHAAAKSVVERFGGEVPSDVDALRSLPGVGPYTAGAIASLAFGGRHPIVDTNIVRVLMRLAGRAGAATDAATVAWAWERARGLVEVSGQPDQFNEGLMELGALVCPGNARPSCDACPLKRWCKAAASGNPSEIPAASTRASRQRVYHHAVVVAQGGEILLVQRPQRGLWASMWQVPTVEAGERLAPNEIRSRLSRRLGALVEVKEFLHRTSHRDVVFIVHRGRTGGLATTAGSSAEGDCPGTWVAADRLADFPLSNPMRSIVDEAMRPPQAIRPGQRAGCSASKARGSGKRSGRGGSRRGS